MYLYMYDLCTEMHCTTLYFIKTMTVLANQRNPIGESWQVLLLTLRLWHITLRCGGITDMKFTVNSC